jgi:hypothetical protein
LLISFTANPTHYKKSRREINKRRNFFRTAAPAAPPMVQPFLLP